MTTMNILAISYNIPTKEIFTDTGMYLFTLTDE